MCTTPGGVGSRPWQTGAKRRRRKISKRGLLSAPPHGALQRATNARDEVTEEEPSWLREAGEEVAKWRVEDADADAAAVLAEREATRALRHQRVCAAGGRHRVRDVNFTIYNLHVNYSEF